MEKEGGVKVESLQSLNQLRQEFILGGIKFDYFERLKAWIFLSILIVINPKRESLQPRSNSFCQEIKELISKGKLYKAIDKLLEVLQGKD